MSELQIPQKKYSKTEKLLTMLSVLCGLMSVFALGNLVQNQSFQETVFFNNIPINEPTLEKYDYSYSELTEDATQVAVNILDKPHEYRANPQNVPSTQKQTSDFSNEYKTPEQWLNSLGITNITVIFTNEPESNCGITENITLETAVTGCYHTAYGKTLFIYWGENTNQNMRKLVLLHEYSHYVQAWEHEEYLTSAAKGNLYENEEFLTKLETDATCRVYQEWGYTGLEYLDYRLSSPCQETQWNNDYLLKTTEKLFHAIL